MLLDELLIDGFKPNALVVVTAVGALTQGTVAAQIRVVRFATNDEQTGQQREQKLSLRFVKRPTVSSRPVSISLRLSICVFAWL